VDAMDLFSGLISKQPKKHKSHCEYIENNERLFVKKIISEFLRFRESRGKLKYGKCGGMPENECREKVYQSIA
jgi:hypothetical protein